MYERFRICWALIVHSIQKDMAFRSNFFINGLNTVLVLVAGLGGLFVLYFHTDSINGWDYGQTQLVLGVYLLVQALKNLVIGPSLSRLAGLDGDLWTGNFDFTLLKPVPTQWYISVQSWSLWALVDVGAAGLVLALAWRYQPVPSWGELLGFGVSLLIGMGLLYGILLVLASAAFWYLGTPMMWIFDSLFQLGRFPVRLYPVGLELLLTWVIPMGFIVTIPAEWLRGQGSPLLLLGGLGLLFLVWLASSRFFQQSLLRYSSASS